MNMRMALIAVLVLCSAVPAFPCLNKTGTKYGGGSTEFKSSGWQGMEQSLKKNLQYDGVAMEAILRGSTNFNDRSDYAVALMYLGRNSEAVTLLNHLEAEQPGHFFVAANLGTAYELSGDNAAALKWINEGIRRNPEDHKGTEWLHAKILEAKIAHEKEPDYFKHHSVLELQPEAIGQSLEVGKKSMSPGEVMGAIAYQLKERLQFVKPPEPAVASLLFDYAAIEAATSSMESAKHILKMATKYGYPAAKVDALDREFDRRLAWKKYRRYAWVALAGACVIALLVVAYRRRILVYVRSSRDLKKA
jgi:tetratricopeptide (TPR) repeat protein